MIILIGNEAFIERGLEPESTSWYKKTSLTFSDLLEAFREELGDVVNMANSLLTGKFENNLSSMDDNAHKLSAM